MYIYIYIRTQILKPVREPGCQEQQPRGRRAREQQGEVPDYKCHTILSIIIIIIIIINSSIIEEEVVVE